MSEANYETIIALLDAADVTYQTHEHEAIRTVDEVVEKLPHLAPIMVKTIAFSLKDGRIVQTLAIQAKSGESEDIRNIMRVMRELEL